MIVEDQDATIEWLASRDTHGGSEVERIDTHTAVVFLADGRAFKLKRAVRFDYVDFSTVAKRHEACVAELRVNRRTAPAIYRRVVPVTRSADGRMALDGDGTPVDWVIEMARFDQDGLFDRLAATGALDLSLMRPLAETIAAFHAAAAPRRDHGGAAGMRWVIEGNAESFASEARDVLDQNEAADVTVRARAELGRQADRLDRRRADGQVRECHGDLHLRNLVRIDGRPVLFDAIEFNDDIACIDTLYDIAFLLMDLWRRHLPQHANAVFNGYVAETGELDGLALLPLFLSCRAAVRAKTSVSAAGVQTTTAERRRLENASREYLTMAGDLLRPAAPRLVAIGGFSGTGKSTVAHRLAHALGAPPGALVLRSDEIRKALCHVGRLDPLGPDGYDDTVTAEVYRTLAARAAAALAAGRSVIADAVFRRAGDRDAIARAAAEVGAPLAGLWLDAPEETLVARVTARRDDPSDASAGVVRHQLAQPVGELRWTAIDASGTIARVVQNAADQLSLVVPGGTAA
jgi:aminoglycoside phosphotransferase family enzyme/predicted kinase